MGSNKKPKPTPPKVLDLFSGAGGLSLGAARAGLKVLGAAEIDSNAAAAYQTNFPKTICTGKDISTLTGNEIMEIMGLRNGELAGILGGPPCQGFSRIGKNEPDDDRNKLFLDFFRIVAEMKPKFFLAENVPGILTDQNAKIRKTALSYVENHYSLLLPLTICAKDFGAPTTRTRIFFVGYQPNEMEALYEEDFSPPLDIETVRIKDALNGLPVKISPDWQTEEKGWRVVKVHGNGFFHSRLHGHIPSGVGGSIALKRLKQESRASGCLGTIHSKKIANRYSKIEPGKRDPISKSTRLVANGFCPTIRAGTGSDHGSYQAVRPLHPTENRVITPREAARLQGFPDWFQFSPTKWHSFRQIGSSVSPILAEHILARIMKALAD